MAHQHIDGNDREEKTHQHRPNNPQVQGLPHAEQLRLPLQPQEHPIAVCVGGIVGVKLHGGQAGVQELSVEGNAVYMIEVVVLGFHQPEAALAQQQIGKVVVSGNGAIAAVCALHGNQIAVVGGIGAYADHIFLNQRRQGNLDAENRIDLTVSAQGNGIGDDLIAASRVVLQTEGLRPVAQIPGFRLRIFPSGSPGSVVEFVGFADTLPRQGEVGGPVAAQGNAQAPGQQRAAPGKGQVAIVRRLGSGVIVPEIKAADIAGNLRAFAGHQQEAAGGFAVLRHLQAHREHFQQKFLLKRLGAIQLLQRQPVFLQELLQGLGQLRLYQVNPAPTLEHLGFQPGPAVFRGLFRILHGVALNGAHHVPEFNDAQNQGALNDHQNKQRYQE